MVASKSVPKGFALEEALRAYFSQAGFFAVRGVPYRLNGDDVTDVDLWLYEKPATVTRRRLIIDAKNKKSPKAAERIIWAKGLQEALAVNDAIVATTDRRSSTRRLAKNLGVGILDGEALRVIEKSMASILKQTLPAGELDALVKAVDDTRKSSDWRTSLDEMKASLLHGFGVQSANRSLNSFGYFSQQAVLAQPNSKPAVVATRVAYFAAALALISLDAITAELRFMSSADQRASIINGIRYGQADPAPSNPSIRAAIALIRKYSNGGVAISKQVEEGFKHEAEQIPADIIADFVSKSDNLFELACALDQIASSNELRAFDKLDTNIRSALGAFLDFAGVPRVSFANAMSGGERGLLVEGLLSKSQASDVGTLFAPSGKDDK